MQKPMDNISGNNHYDVAIVGGGLVGSLLAYALLKLKPCLNIVLIDENSAPQTNKKSFVHPGFDARSLALSAGTCDILKQLGFWQEIKHNAQPIDNIHISDRGFFGALDLPKKNKKQVFGYVVELHEIGIALKKQLDNFKQLTRLYDTRLLNIEKYPQQVICQLTDNKNISANLCVAADGGNSVMRALLAIESQTSDYGCSAIIANLRCSKPHRNKAFERFTEFGPIALLPLTDNRYSLVWSVGNTDLPRLGALNDEQFLAELQEAFGYRAGIFCETGKRDVYPLKLIKTLKPVNHRSVCIGNAAHALHPVMGQGFNLGLRDLFVLASVIGAVENPKDIGSFVMLNHYWSARVEDHENTINLTDSMVRIFSNRNWPLILGRNIALQAMSVLPDLTAPIVKQAKGQFKLFN
jgi:2-octaprenyl-6-methoxyphenol hydroxylase